MKRVLGLAGCMLLCMSLVGCGTDPREGMISAAIGDLDSAATKVANIKTRIDEAIKKTEAGKTPDFKDALLEVDALKKIGKEMQELKMKADGHKDKGTEDERKKLADDFKNQVVSAFDRLYKAKKELNDTILAVESQHKDALKAVREKLIEAEGEFEAIARQR